MTVAELIDALIDPAVPLDAEVLLMEGCVGADGVEVRCDGGRGLWVLIA